MTTDRVVVASREYQVNSNIKPQALEGLSEKLLDQHWKLYEGYVTNVNFLNKTIGEAVASGQEINKPNLAELQRRLGFEFNGMVLHEYYFGGMKKRAKEPAFASSLISALSASYGSLDRWKNHFMQSGKMRGIGWVITVLDPTTSNIFNTWVSDHEVGHIAGFIPLIVMDCWEHAYALDFGVTGKGRGDYIDTYFRNIHWDALEERFEAARQGRILPRIKA